MPETACMKQLEQYQEQLQALLHWKNNQTAVSGPKDAPNNNNSPSNNNSPRDHASHVPCQQNSSVSVPAHQNSSISDTFYQSSEYLNI